MSGQTRRHIRALSMIEVLIAATVLAVGVAAVAAALVAGAQQSYEAVQTQRAAMLVEAMIDEIVALPYDDPQGASGLGPDAGENGRTAFDNVDDYHNYSEAAGSVLDAQGAAYPESFDALSRSVTATAVSLQPAGFSSAVTGLNVTVTVEMNGRTMASATRFVADPEP